MTDTLLSNVMRLLVVAPLLLLSLGAERASAQTELAPWWWEPSADEGLVASDDPTLSAALDRIAQLEQVVAGLQAPAIGDPAEQPSLVMNAAACDDGAANGSCASDACPSHYVIYDNGWTLRPYDPDRMPFEMKIELHNQFRFTHFAERGEAEPDAAGVPRDLSDRNDFDINRGRLVFSGNAFSPDFGYYLNIDYSTVEQDAILPLLAWTTYRFNDRFAVFMGLGKVPGTWEWQQTSRFTLGVDRSMATTFFRPSISAGIWVDGSLTDRMHYTAFMGDGYSTLSLRPEDLDTKLVYSALAWWEPLGAFGPGFSDLENHESAVIRVGHGLTQTQNEQAEGLTPTQEGTVIRLTDGTRLIDEGALQPGVSVNAFDIWLYSLHAGIKRNGFSVSGEYYLRWLRNLEGTPVTPLQSLFDQGYFVQSAAFVVPQSLELFARGSQVTGEQGTGDEVSVGFNWYLYGKRNARATLEWTSLDDSPAQQARTGFVAGGSGNLIRAQLWTFF